MAVLSTSYEVESGFDTTLKTSISSTQTSGIIINRVPTVTSGALLLDAETEKEEWIGFGSVTDNGNNTATLGDVTRGLNLTGDTFTGSATRAFSHSGGVCKVALVDYHSLFNLKANKDRENTFTADQTIGTGKIIKFTDSTAAIRRDGNNLKFKDPNQAEVSLFQLANLSGVNDKTKISIADTTEGYLNDKLTARNGLSKSIANPGANESIDLDIDLTDSTIFSATGVAGKVPLYDGSGNLPAGNKLVTSGTANTTTTDQYALSYNGNTKLDLADGNQAALNQEWLLAGIANGASTDGNAQSYYPFGPIVTVPAFTLSQRQSCRLWDGQSNATSNTTGDTVSTTIEWRAQTFTPTTGQDNVSAFVLNFTKTSSPNGSSTVALYATSGGLPTGAALATCTTILNSAITTGDNTFSLTTPYAVTPGTVYAIVWSSGISAGGNLAWNYQNTDVYATGQRCTSANSGTNWTAAATNDMRFTVQYRGIAGEPVYLSDTAGQLQLTPGTYNSQIGKAVSTTSIMLQERSKTVFGTISSSVTTTGSVNSEVTIGFRPSWIYVVSTWAYAPGTLAYPAGFFLATHASSNNSAGLSFSAQRGATANAAIVSGVRESAPVAGINFTGKDTADTSVTVGTVSLSAMSANSVTINRNITTHPGGSVTLTTNFIAFQ